MRLALATVVKGKAGLHTQRFEERRIVLGRVFTKANLEKAWSSYVRAGLRAQEISDLHDYNDFHWARDAIFENLLTAILSGQYVPSRSVPVQVEKRHGVNRTLVIPSASDALVLQCLVEYLLPKALSRQPSKNSFFSRSHGFAHGPELKFDKDYIWFSRWIQFSKLRFKVASTHSHVCVTDIANYFDNIDYTHLRNMISELDGVEEVVMDLLFTIIDSISWRPDYLPSPHRSLPQVDFDAPRLLSHIYLFEVDAFLKKKASNQFVRWVDDITVAVASATDAKLILRDLDQILMTRGLRLNAGKTNVLSAKDAHRFFWSKRNAELDAEAIKAKKFATMPKRLATLTARIEKSFDDHLAAERYGHWDKVTKRYIGQLGRLRSQHAVDFCRIAIVAEPGLRETIWRYFVTVGPSTKLIKSLEAYLMSDHALDDSSLFAIAKVMVDWEIDPNSAHHKRIKNLGMALYSKPHTGRLDFRFLAALWILAKYGRAPAVMKLLDDHQRVWLSSEFLCRQVAALLPKFRDAPFARKLRKRIERHQFEQATAVLSSLDAMGANASGCTSATRLYILNGRHSGPYSLQRFLICLHVLTNKNIDPLFRTALKADVLKYVNDPIYRKVISSVNP